MLGHSPCVRRWGGCLWPSWWSSWCPPWPGSSPRYSDPASISAPRPRSLASLWCWLAAWAPAASPWRSSGSSWPPGLLSWRSRWCWAAWGRNDQCPGSGAAWAPAWCDTALAPSWSASQWPGSRRGRVWWRGRAPGRRAPPWPRSGWRSAPRPGLCPCLKHWLIKYTMIQVFLAISGALGVNWRPPSPKHYPIMKWFNMNNWIWSNENTPLTQQCTYFNKYPSNPGFI